MKANKKEKIKQSKRKRKNFLPTLIVIFFLWLFTFSFIYFIEPSVFGAIPLFFLLLFFTFLLTFSTIFFNTRRGLITSIALIAFLILRLFGIGNPINFLLIVGVAITFEVYFTKRIG